MSMQINLTGRHVEITTALKEYVDTKFAKLARHFEHINHVNVVLTVEKLKQIAEAKINLSGAEVFAISDDENMYAAIDQLIDKLDRQVIKHKEKLIRH
jgi:putative sigma-54 modulation protein